MTGQFFLLVSLLLVITDAARDIIAPASTSTTTKLSIEWLGDDMDNLAVCNDGSRGAYYFSPSLDPSMANHFIIYLPGGGQCFDEASCAQRWKDAGPTYMSSKGISNTIEKSGILASDPSMSPLWAANKAVLSYCSSDGYMGDAPASASTWNWHFRGQRLIRAMIEHLMKYKGLNSDSIILLGGSSAGGRGMMTNAHSLFTNYLPAGSNVALFLDSPYYIDIAPYASNFAGFQYQEQNKYAVMNTKDVLSTDCSTMYANDPSQLWKCQFGEYRMPHVALDVIPYLLIASQDDAYQLSMNTQRSPPYNLYPDSNQLLSYASNFEKHTKQSLANLQQYGKEKSSSSSEQSTKTTTNAIFSWACYNHAIADTTGFSTVKTIAGVSQHQALTIWLATDPFVTVPARENSNQEQVKDDSETKQEFLLWMDECEGFACGTGC